MFINALFVIVVVLGLIWFASTVYRYNRVDWEYSSIDPDIRRDPKTGRTQAYSDDLNGWYDLGYLQGTNYDAGYWLTTITKDFFYDTKTDVRTN